MHSQKKTAKENTGEKVIVLRRFQQVSPAPVTSGKKSLLDLAFNKPCTQPVKVKFCFTRWEHFLAFVIFRVEKQEGNQLGAPVT